MSNGKQAKGQNEARDFRRFIEESFPVKEVGEESAREKNIRHGHISTLHIWWARRPLAASRATAYAALTPAPKDAEEWQKKRDFIIQLSQWENSNNQSLLERARREILEANGGVPPKVLDPFSGGGSYPLEALRLGCESYANDYNPVAVLIEKATLEYPQKFGRPFEGMPDWAKPDLTPSPSPERRGGKGKSKKKVEGQPALFDPTVDSEPTDFNPLLNAVRYWGENVLEEARKELAEFYPPDPDGSIPVGFIWARTIPCQNPACGCEIPLLRQFFLVKTAKKKVALYPKVSKGKLEFQIVGSGYKNWPEGFDPSAGITMKAITTCPVCGSIIDGDTTRRLFIDGKNSQKMIAVILISQQRTGKIYRIANANDEIIYDQAEKVLSEKVERLSLEWGLNPIPDEPITKERPSPNARGTSAVTRYGYFNWGDLFNTRQKLALVTFVEKIRATLSMFDSQNAHFDFSKAVSTYLGIALDRMASYNTSNAPWHVTREIATQIFGRQALSMVWDYAETNPFGDSFSWSVQIDWIVRFLDNLSKSSKSSSKVTQSSATQIPYPDGYFDAILTDPPYYIVK